MEKVSLEKVGGESKTKAQYLRRPTMKLNLSTEALARASSRHPWTTIGAWLTVLVAAIVLSGTLLGDALTTEFAITNNPDSQRGYTLLEERLRGPRKATEVVAVQSATLTVDDQAFRDRVEELYGDIIALGDDVIEGAPITTSLGTSRWCPPTGRRPSFPSSWRGPSMRPWRTLRRSWI